MPPRMCDRYPWEGFPVSKDQVRRALAKLSVCSSFLLTYLSKKYLNRNIQVCIGLNFIKKRVKQSKLVMLIL